MDGPERDVDEGGRYTMTDEGATERYRRRGVRRGQTKTCKTRRGRVYAGRDVMGREARCGRMWRRDAAWDGLWVETRRGRTVHGRKVRHSWLRGGAHDAWTR